MAEEEQDIDQGESTDLDQAFLDEDPQILTDAELKQIADAFGIPLDEYKALVKNMTRTRRDFAKQTDNYPAV